MVKVESSSSFEDGDYMNEFHAGVNRFRINGEFTDFSIGCGPKTFRVHKLIMMASSPYFEVMLTCDLREKKTGELILKDMNHKAVEVVIAYIYTATIDLAETSATEVMKVASLWQLDYLRDRCRQYCLDQLTPGSCVAVMDIAQRLQDKKLLTSALEFAATNFAKITDEINFLLIGEDHLKMLLKSGKLGWKDDTQILCAVVKWVEADELERNPMLPDIMKLIHLPNVDPLRLLEIFELKMFIDSPRCLKIIDLTKNYLILAEYPDKLVEIMKQIKGV